MCVYVCVCPTCDAVSRAILSMSLRQTFEEGTPTDIRGGYTNCQLRIDTATEGDTGYSASIYISIKSTSLSLSLPLSVWRLRLCLYRGYRGYVSIQATTSLSL